MISKAFAVECQRGVWKAHRLAPAQRGVAGHQRLDLRAHLGVLRIGQGGNEAHRHEAVHDHLLWRPYMFMAQTRLFQRAKPGVGERSAPVAFVKARRVALESVS